MTKTPEEIAEAVRQEAWDEQGSVIEDCTLPLIAAAIREAEDRGRKSSSVDASKCGLWCPNCGTHLRAPKS